MARMPRFFLPETPLHVIVRGNNRAAIVADDNDRVFLRNCLRYATRKHAVAVHAYVVMTNHLHVLATPATKLGLPKAMQAFGRVYVRYYNDRYSRTGTLWDGRYKAAIIDQERYLLMCMRYVELNPVRARIVEQPQHYRWSSFAANALGARDDIVTPHALYLELGDDAGARAATYREATGMRIPRRELATIRDMTQHAWALGESSFIRRVDMFARRGNRLPLGRPRNRVETEEVESDPTY
jgi:putative transposase